MADAFRQMQKKTCLDGGKKAKTYGCPCCRVIADLREFKKYSRRNARRVLKQQDDSFMYGRR